MGHLGRLGRDHRHRRPGAPDVPGARPRARSASTAASWTSRRSARRWRGSRREARQRPDLRERAGPAADLPAHVARVRRRHRRPLGAGAGLVDVQRRPHEHVQPQLLDPQDAREVPGPRTWRLNEFPAGPVRETLLSIVGDDDLARAAAGLGRGRDRAVDRGDARPLRAARLHPLPRGPLRLLAREDPLPERVRRVHPALPARAGRADAADLLHAVLPPAVQAVVRARRPQGRHRQPLAPRRLEDAQRRRPDNLARREGLVTD